MHENIIEVFIHDKFPDSSYDFIDMKFCDMNLNDFIKSTQTFGIIHQFISKFSAMKIWNIMKQIINSLTFIHKSNEIHRDLKPKNDSTHINLNANSLIILYSTKIKCWKLTNFDLTFKDKSQDVLNTKFARETPDYQALELLLKNISVYNKKS